MRPSKTSFTGEKLGINPFCEKLTGFFRSWLFILKLVPASLNR